jgi:hypothetical protein
LEDSCHHLLVSFWNFILDGVEDEREDCTQ